MIWASLGLCLVVFSQVPPTGARGPSQSRPSTPPEYFKAVRSRQDQGNLSRVVLHNGLVILIEEHPVCPLEAVVTYVKVGTADESPGETGAAALLSLVQLKAGGFAPAVQKLGGNAESKADRDGIYFCSIAPADNWAKVLDAHAALLVPPQVDERRIQREAQLLVAERRRGPSSTVEWGRRRVWEMLYGPSQDPKSGGAGIKSFHAKYYRPARVILAFSGPVVREQILEKVVELYGKTRAPRTAPKASAETVTQSIVPAPGSGFLYQCITKPVLQPCVIMGYRVPGIQQQDHYPLELLARLLGQGRSSPLQQYLVEQGPEAFLAEACLQGDRAGGVLFLTLRPQATGIDAAEVGILAHLEAIKRQGVRDTALERAKALLLNDYYQRLQRLEDRARLLVLHERLGNGLERDKVLQTIRGLSPEDVLRVLRRYCTDLNLAILEMLPEQAERRTFTPASFLESCRLLLPAALQEALDNLATEDVRAPREIPALPLRFTPTYSRPGLKKTSIVRGPAIYFQEEHVLPLALIQVVLPGGRIRESSSTAGMTEVMLEALIAGSPRRKGAIPWSDLERMGAQLTTINEPDFFGLQVWALSPYAEELLSALIEILRHPEVDDSSVGVARRRVLAQQAQEDEDPRAVALSSARRSLLAGHPYALGRYGSAESVANLTPEAVRHWVATLVRDRHPLILIRGDIQGTSILHDLVSTLSDRRYSSPEPVKQEVSPTVSTESWTRRTSGSDNFGALAFPGPVVGSKDEQILDVIEAVLSGPGGTLAATLWEEQGLASAVELRHETRLSGGATFASLTSLPGKTDDAWEELKRQLDQLTVEPWKQDQFMSGLVRAITALYVRHQDAGSYLQDLALAVFAGSGVEFEREYISAIRDVQREDIPPLVVRYFNTE